jgi:hypothetical protein
MYQPRISDENIRRLYLLKVQAKKPMTHVLDDILNEYFATRQEEIHPEGLKKSPMDRIHKRAANTDGSRS